MASQTMTVQSRKGSQSSASGQANIKRNMSSSRLASENVHVASTAGKKKSRSSANLVSMSTHHGGPSQEGSHARPRKSADSAHKKRGSSSASLKHLAQEASGYGFTVAPQSRGKPRNREKLTATLDAESFSPDDEEADGWKSVDTSDNESAAHTPNAGTTPPTSASTLASSHGNPPKEQTAQAVQETLPQQPEQESVTSPSQLATTPKATPPRERKTVPAIQTHSPAVQGPSRPAQTKRKPSTTSTLAPSIRSLSSFRNGPPTPRSMRQSASALVPVLDTNVTVAGKMAEDAFVDFPQSTSPERVQQTRPGGQHVRSISSASTRTESGSDLARRLRQASGVSSSGSASSGERKRTPSAGAEGLRSSASGYFGSLRNLAKSSASLVSMGRETSSPLASPITEAPPAGVAIRKNTSGAQYGPSSRYKPSSAGSHPGFTPLISKFISPSDSSPIESYLPPPRRHPSTGGDVSPPHQPRQMACSRKLLMQKNAPLTAQPYSGQRATLLPANMNNSSLNLAAKFAPMSSPQESNSEFHLNEPEEKLQQQQQKRAWGVAVMREAERVEKEHEAIKRWRDPVAESFQRVMKKRAMEKEAANKMKGQSSRPSSTRASTTRH